MPYIEQSARWGIEDDQAEGYDFCAIAKRLSGPGELNYVFSLLAKGYFEAHSTYQGINDIVGALDGAKLEFYRRIVVPYEDKKIIANGDVYTHDDNPGDHGC